MKYVPRPILRRNRSVYLAQHFLLLQYQTIITLQINTELMIKKYHNFLHFSYPGYLGLAVAGRCPIIQ